MADRFITPCELPSDYERELLTIFIEECAEAQKRATKLLRFGRDGVQPGQPLNNSTRLAHEIGDIEEMISLLAGCHLVRTGDILEGRTRKKKQLATYMQQARP